MPDATFVYKTRRYRVSFLAVHEEEVRLESDHLTSCKAWREELWTHQQFVDILAAFECVYSRRNVCDGSLVVLEKVYRRSRFRLQVPGQLFFRATLHLENIMSIASVRNTTVSIDDFRRQWDRFIIIGSSTLGAVFAWGTLWSMPLSVSRPIAGFGHAMEEIFVTPCCTHPRTSRTLPGEPTLVVTLGQDSFFNINI